MLRALIDLLGVEPNGVGYLEPMLRATDLVAIASLNYDLAVETAGDNFGLDVDTGLSNWTGGYEWSWRSDADVRLLKLHGSIDYVLASHQATSDRMAGDRLDRTDSDDDNRPQFGSPAMVFGQGSKLRSDGPFLAMLVELDRILERTEWLTIIGYSFRDDHINAALTRWVNGSLAERLTIIDPSIGKWDTSERTAPTYLRHLLDAARGCTREEAGKWGLTWPELWLDLEPSGAKCGLVQFDFDS